MPNLSVFRVDRIWQEGSRSSAVFSGFIPMWGRCFQCLYMLWLKFTKFSTISSSKGFILNSGDVRLGKKAHVSQRAYIRNGLAPYVMGKTHRCCIKLLISYNTKRCIELSYKVTPSWPICARSPCTSGNWNFGTFCSRDSMNKERNKAQVFDESDIVTTLRILNWFLSPSNKRIKLGMHSQ